MPKKMDWSKLAELLDGSNNRLDQNKWGQSTIEPLRVSYSIP